MGQDKKRGDEDVKKIVPVEILTTDGDQYTGQNQKQSAKHQKNGHQDVHHPLLVIDSFALLKKKDPEVKWCI